MTDHVGHDGSGCKAYRFGHDGDFYWGQIPINSWMPDRVGHDDAGGEAYCFGHDGSGCKAYRFGHDGRRWQAQNIVHDLDVSVADRVGHLARGDARLK